MPRSIQSSERLYAPTKLKTGYPSKFSKKLKTSPPTHLSTVVSYDTFLEQTVQRKMQTNFVICSEVSLKDQHGQFKISMQESKMISGKMISIPNSSALKQEVISTFGSHQFVKSEKVHALEKDFKKEKRSAFLLWSMTRCI